MTSGTMRIAARTWRRTPVLAIVIVVTLALGIGATTTAFTVAYSILVQRFPFPEPTGSCGSRRTTLARRTERAP